MPRVEIHKTGRTKPILSHTNPSCTHSTATWKPLESHSHTLSSHSDASSWSLSSPCRPLAWSYTQGFIHDFFFKARLCDFSHWLEMRPEATAVIVAHWGTIQRILVTYYCERELVDSNSMVKFSLRLHDAHHFQTYICIGKSCSLFHAHSQSTLIMKCGGRDVPHDNPLGEQLIYMGCLFLPTFCVQCCFMSYGRVSSCLTRQNSS